MLCLKYTICFFLSCKANARVYLAKTGHGPHSSLIVLFHVLIVLFYALFVCKCVLYYCHRVSTQLQLNISYHTISYIYTIMCSIGFVNLSYFSIEGYGLFKIDFLPCFFFEPSAYSINNYLSANLLYSG